jgi:DNA helicase HerA-like ATPase
MTMKLNISDDLKLPIDAVTQTFAVMGIRGSGKTHTASVMAEEMLKAGQPIVIYDPTGAWFGLKTSADGKRPGHPGCHLRRRAPRRAAGRIRRRHDRARHRGAQVPRDSRREPDA